MKLYHGTSETSARSALIDGLCPRGSKKSNWEVESRNDLVYLTDAYAPYFAAQASEDGERWAIIEVDVDLDNLLPDEDFLEQATRGSDICPLSSMVARTSWFRRLLERFAHHAEDSLAGLGNAAHYGDIEPDFITRVVLFDPKVAPSIAMMSLDPSISILNYRFLGDKYRALTQALAGYAVEPEALMGLFWQTLPEQERDRWRQALSDLSNALEIAHQK